MNFLRLQRVKRYHLRDVLWGQDAPVHDDKICLFFDNFLEFRKGILWKIWFAHTSPPGDTSEARLHRTPTKRRHPNSRTASFYRSERHPGLLHLRALPPLQCGTHIITYPRLNFLDPINMPPQLPIIFPIQKPDDPYYNIIILLYGSFGFFYQRR